MENLKFDQEHIVPHEFKYTLAQPKLQLNLNMMPSKCFDVDSPLLGDVQLRTTLLDFGKIEKDESEHSPLKTVHQTDSAPSIANQQDLFDISPTLFLGSSIVKQKSFDRSPIMANRDQDLLKNFDGEIIALAPIRHKTACFESSNKNLCVFDEISNAKNNDKLIQSDIFEIPAPIV